MVLKQKELASWELRRGEGGAKTRNDERFGYTGG